MFRSMNWKNARGVTENDPQPLDSLTGSAEPAFLPRRIRRFNLWEEVVEKIVKRHIPLILFIKNSEFILSRHCPKAKLDVKL
jgi:hypothetical protein